MNDESAADVRRFQIRGGLTHDELNEIEDIQRQVWGPDDIVPSPHLRAVEHSGGQLAAAFLGDHMIGFSYGFLAAAHGRGMSGAGLHSHMVAVRSEGRGLGVGQALKWQQRAWALDKGLKWISWTFDPLQARNARLNLEYLGVIAFDYLADFYGPMGGPLGGGQSSDRLLAVWQLENSRVTRRVPENGAQAPVLRRRSGDLSGRTGAQDQETPETGGDDGQFWAVRPNKGSSDAEPLIATEPDLAETVRVAVPSDVTRLMAENPDLVRRWRGAVGVTLARLLQHDYTVVGFNEGAYLLRRSFEE